MILAVLISGALAGLAGMIQVSGVLHVLQIEISPEYGYTALIIAWLSYLNPLIAIFVSLMFGAFTAGGYLIQTTMQIPFGIIPLIEGVVLFVLIGGEILKYYRISFVKRGKQ